MIETKEKYPSKKPMPQEKNEDVDTNLRGIVRIAGKDLHGKVLLKRALMRVTGIGNNLSVSVAALIDKELHISPNIMVGELSDEQIENIDKLLFNIAQYSLPAYLLNHRTDVLDGTNKHHVMTDLMFNTAQDIEREKRAYSWKGYRHAYGQKVRGQKTRNTGRTGMAVGVLRKTILAAAAASKDAGAKGAAGAPAAPAAGGAAKAVSPAAAAKKAAGKEEKK